MLPDIPLCLSYGPVRIELNGIVKGDDSRGLVPYYHFKILDVFSNIVGHINFKVGNTPHVLNCAGHVGYEILPQYRGHSYSFYACMALSTAIRTIYTSVVLTVDRDNIASECIVKRLGAAYIDEMVVPTTDPAYAGTERVKRRYVWYV